MPIPAKYPEYWPQFFTATILEWKFLLQSDQIKNIIVRSLQFLVEQKRIELQAFVIMSNHLHLIWQLLPGQTLQSIQHSFLKYTAQEMKLYLERYDPQYLQQFKVNAKDRVYQFWERNALSVELYSPDVFLQKLNYIHQNPVTAGLCILPEQYYYSSANFYLSGTDGFKMLTRH